MKMLTWLLVGVSIAYLGFIKFNGAGDLDLIRCNIEGIGIDIQCPKHTTRGER